MHNKYEFRISGPNIQEKFEAFLSFMQFESRPPPGELTPEKTCSRSSPLVFISTVGHAASFRLPRRAKKSGLRPKRGCLRPPQQRLQSRPLFGPATHEWGCWVSHTCKHLRYQLVYHPLLLIVSRALVSSQNRHHCKLALCLATITRGLLLLKQQRLKQDCPFQALGKHPYIHPAIKSSWFALAPVSNTPIDSLPISWAGLVCANFFLRFRSVSCQRCLHRVGTGC